MSNQPPGGANPLVPAVTDTTVYVTVTLTEPLLLSPFVFGSPENNPGFYGITNMNFQMNMASDANRAWRSVRFPIRRSGANSCSLHQDRNSPLCVVVRAGLRVLDGTRYGPLAVS